MEQHLDSRKLKCPKCGNVWTTDSKYRVYVTCSNRKCKHKVDARKYITSEKVSERKKRVS